MFGHQQFAKRAISLLYHGFPIVFHIALIAFVIATIYDLSPARGHYDEPANSEGDCTEGSLQSSDAADTLTKLEAPHAEDNPCFEPFIDSYSPVKYEVDDTDDGCGGYPMPPAADTLIHLEELRDGSPGDCGPGERGITISI